MSESNSTHTWWIAHQHGETGAWYVSTYDNEDDAQASFDSLVDADHCPIGPYEVSESLAGVFNDPDDDEAAARFFEILKLVEDMVSDAADVGTLD